MGDLSINENSNLETPNLDSIAREGALIGLPSNVSRGFDRKPRMDGYVKVFEPMLIGEKIDQGIGAIKVGRLGNSKGSGNGVSPVNVSTNQNIRNLKYFRRPANLLLPIGA